MRSAPGAALPLVLAIASFGGSAIARAQSVAPVDLLHAVGTELAVSSVYRSQATQAARLVDGDLETAWNSRTGDLVGAWIEVRLPADATVTSLAMTPGFTHHTADRDLFTSNHRVSSVRVLHDGSDLGTFPLDVTAPALVTIPVQGGGGVYRVEIVAVTPGSRSDWRETCISELRVMGTAPGAAAGTRLPRTAVGALPAPVAPAAADRTAIARADRRDVAWLVTAWNEPQHDVDSQDENTGEPDPDAELRAEFEQQRDAILRRVAALVAPIDPARSDALRLEEARIADWRTLGSRSALLTAMLERVTGALEAVATFLGDDESRCRTARALAGIRLRRAASASHIRAYYQLIEESMDGVSPSEPGGRHLDEDDEQLGDASLEWERNARGVATRMSRRRAPADSSAAAEWAPFLAQVEIAHAACGW